MKSFFRISALFVLSLTAIGCSNNVSSSNGGTSESSSTSTFTPSIPSRQEGVTLEAFTEETNKLSAMSEKPFRMTFQITETLVGTYPIYKRNSSELLAEGVYNSTLVIESSDGSLSKTKVVGDRPNTTNNSDLYASGTTYDVKGWLAYHKQRRSFLDSAQEGEGFKETFYLESFRMWFVSWGNRPANSSVEGTYFGFEEQERTFDENGYCKTIYLKDYRYMDGVFSRWDTQPKEYHGSYETVVNGTVEYLS